MAGHSSCMWCPIACSCRSASATRRSVCCCSAIERSAGDSSGCRCTSSSRLETLAHSATVRVRARAPACHSGCGCAGVPAAGQTIGSTPSESPGPLTATLMRNWRLDASPCGRGGTNRAAGSSSGGCSACCCCCCGGCTARLRPGSLLRAQMCASALHLGLRHGESTSSSIADAIIIDTSPLPPRISPPSLPMRSPPCRADRGCFGACTSSPLLTPVLAPPPAAPAAAAAGYAPVSPAPSARSLSACENPELSTRPDVVCRNSMWLESSRSKLSGPLVGSPLPPASRSAKPRMGMER
mmetsp:Transcript_22518/g.67050  ORF Transcript_22518/g.67050 Transcript_22518/m.67050 type:complete len:297 (-) Transcript_22518:143-1033(-)